MDRSISALLRTISRSCQFELRNIRSFATIMASTSQIVQTPALNATATDRTYENSIKTLNALQTNAQVLASMSHSPEELKFLIPGTVIYLERGGLSMSQLDSLNVIHVSGTKGKGTTCAFVESILRNAGLRTGFFSSPHLVAVRERIRIDGKPISEEKFSQYFFRVYEGIDKAKKSKDDLPAYFRFLTCMAYYVFYHEKVDVAIMEVGIGGSHDPTNIIRSPKVVGITSLGLDHQNVLGKTLKEITARKAGIMKPQVPSITVSNPQPEVLQWLQSHAEEAGSSLHQAPPLEDYKEHIVLGIDDGDVSRINASLALQLSNVFLASCFPSKLRLDAETSRGDKRYPLQQWHLDGLRNCVWQGRFQAILAKPNLHYYLDGAHTEESLIAARNWFMKTTINSDSLRVLVFYITGNRDAEKLLKPFVNGCFDLVIFCPLVISSSNDFKPNADNWSSIRADEGNNCESLIETWRKLNGETDSPKAVSVNSVQAALQYLECLSTNQRINGSPIAPEKHYKNVSVLFTGSLLLVGNFLTVLDPKLL